MPDKTSRATADKNIVVMRFTSKLKLLTILVALCNSHIVTVCYIWWEFLKTSTPEVFLTYCNRPVIEENTACVVAANCFKFCTYFTPTLISRNI